MRDLQDMKIYCETLHFIALEKLSIYNYTLQKENSTEQKQRDSKVLTMSSAWKCYARAKIDKL